MEKWKNIFWLFLRMVVPNRPSEKSFCWRIIDKQKWVQSIKCTDWWIFSTWTHCWNPWIRNRSLFPCFSFIYGSSWLLATLATVTHLNELSKWSDLTWKKVDHRIVPCGLTLSDSNQKVSTVSFERFPPSKESWPLGNIDIVVSSGCF